MSDFIGYARVSTKTQDLSLQLEDLKKAGCNQIFSDVVSGAKSKRVGLDQCLAHLKSGDTLVVWRLDRLGRSMSHLVSVVSELKARGVAFKSLNDGIVDTTTASGELIFNIFSALAQFERQLIRERTHAGLKAAREQGKKGGRRPITPDNPKVRMAKKIYQERNMSINEICSSLSISRATFYRYISLT